MLERSDRIALPARITNDLPLVASLISLASLIAGLRLKE